MDIAAHGLLFTDRVFEETRRLAAQHRFNVGQAAGLGGLLGPVLGPVDMDNPMSAELITGQINHLEKILQQPLVVQINLEDAELPSRATRGSIVDRIAPNLNFLLPQRTVPEAAGNERGNQTPLRSKKADEDATAFMIADEEDEEGREDTDVKAPEQEEATGLLTLTDSSVRSGRVLFRGDQDWEQAFVQLHSDAKMTIRHGKQMQILKIDMTYAESQSVRLDQICTAGTVEEKEQISAMGERNKIPLLFCAGDEKEEEQKLPFIVPQGGPVHEDNGLLLITKDIDAECNIKIYYAKGQLSLRCSSVEDRRAWLADIKNVIKANTTDEDWRTKDSTFTDLLRLKRDVLPESSLRYASLLHSLNNSGFYVESPVSSKMVGENSCVASVEPALNSNSWTPYFIVLDGRTLVYYENPQSGKPVGVFKLRYTEAYVDFPRLRKLEYIIKLQSPSQQLRIKFKHVVHMAEMLARINSALNNGLGEKIAVPKTVNMILERLQRFTADLSSIKALLRHDEEIDVLAAVLKDSKESHYLRFLRELQKYKRVPLPARIDYARELCEGFIIDNSPFCINYGIDPTIVERTYSHYVEARIEHFKHFESWALQHLQERAYNLVKNSEELQQLQKIVSKPMPGTENDVIDDTPALPADKIRILEIAVESRLKDDKAEPSPKSQDTDKPESDDQSAKGPKIFKFSNSRRAVAIGRDSSFDIRISDSRVSRCHGRFYMAHDHLIYFDLGSSHGTLLNGSPILRAQLNPGDLLQVGRARVQFLVVDRQYLEERKAPARQGSCVIS